ncbi:SsrA-binding protein [Parelusimicrobium proximum]|uniref:SsrA-binding protein SmpB n=1 Tax=Parelusimicrobium proximum TaxID=3228953 RepID=UPI003D1752F2
MARKNGAFTAVSNRKAYHNYSILDTYEAGLELLGSEVKSLRLKEASLDSAFIKVENMQAYLYNFYIKPYKFNTVTEVDAVRKKRLLLHTREINKLDGAAQIKGNALIPLEIYFKNGWAKVKVGIGKGKQLFDKRDTIKKKDLTREAERTYKNKIKF